MAGIFAQQAFLPEGWVKNVRVNMADGRIAAVQSGAAMQPDDVRADSLLPALSNLHSHSFQRAMAGMTEFCASGRESFWTWRETMYAFLSQLTPEHVEAIAALAFMEMQETGYAAVGEFHYLHHPASGGRYANIAELSLRIMAAAENTGIGLTHLPVLYCYGGAAKQPLAGGQLRFGNDMDAFASLHGAVKAAAKGLPPDAIVGVAPHSLRAISPEELVHLRHLAGDKPFHIHVAEQPKEVSDIQAWLGARPVEWLLANADVTSQWCCIHATHMTAEETAALARSGAVAGLCPITEANLGDGPFNARDWLAADGSFGVGSDSNVRIALGEELRMLEYSQRLRHLKRNVLAPQQGSTGTQLYKSAAQGGAQALGRAAGEIKVGLWADLLAIDSQSLALCGLKTHQLLDGLCFAAGDGIVTDLWSAGRHMVRNGRHIAHEGISKRYRAALADLTSML